MNQRLSDSIAKCTAALAANVDLSLKLAESNLRSWQAPSTAQEHYRGVTPWETIYSFDTMRVFRFRGPDGKTPDPGQTPLLLIPSMINRSYIMDLMKDSTLVGDMVAHGLPTYMIDWGEPGPQHDHLHFDFFFDELIGKAIRAIRRETGSEKVHLLGYCMAGTMSLLYTALHPDQVERLTLLASPVNFHDEGTLSKWADAKVFPVDEVIKVIKHMEASMLQQSFSLLKPLSYYQKMKNTYESCVDPKAFTNFVHLETWSNDNTNVPGQAYAEYVKLCYHENALVKKIFEFRGHKIDLGNVRCPVLNVMASKDHIVPLESSRVITKIIGGKVEECVVDAGHIGVVMGRKARSMFETVARFFKTAS